jgi:hypothetical protein
MCILFQRRKLHFECALVRFMLIMQHLYENFEFF